MRWLNDIWFRVRAVLSRGSMQADLDDEIAFHVEMEAKKYQAQGTPPREALRKARLRFGGEERFKEQARESWGVSPLMDLGGDVRFSVRQLMKNPAFSAVAALTLALGIGGTVALFSVVYGLMIRPLPIAEQEQVVAFWSDFNWRGEEFDLVKGVPRNFESVAAYSNEGYTLRTEAGSSLVLATVASVELWDVLGAKPLFGRVFQEGEDRPGNEPVVILAHTIWAREFGADRDIVGQRISLDGVQHTVVGVMPEDFYFPSPEMELFVPLNLDPDDGAYASNGWLVLTGRLRQGVTPQQVDEDLQAITTVLGERYNYPGAWDKTRSPYVTPIHEYLLGDVGPAMLLLLATVSLLLLMACVNVTALILTKTVDRTREMSVRAALGAGRARLARQVLTESVILGLVAGTLGILLAVGLFDLLVASLPIDAAFRQTLSLDWTALLTALVLAVASGGLIALAPMRNLLRGELADGALTSRTEGAGAAHAGQMQNALVVAEVLLAVVLATGASLLARTVGELRSLDTGFEAEGVMTMDVLVSQTEISEAERAVFFDQLLERAAAIPGVSAVGFTNRLLLRDGGYQGPVTIDGRPDLEGTNRPNVMFRTFTPGTFSTFGMEAVQGRLIQAADGPDAPLVAVISQGFARRIWGDENPIGRTYRTGFVGDVEVVGVVEDIAVSSLVGDPPMTAFYSWNQAARGDGGVVLVAKTSGDPAALATPLRAIVQTLEPRAAVGRLETMTHAVDEAMAEPLRLRFFLGLFSLLGIVLGTIGVYGVVSYSVQRRRTEFGIRMALGAEPVSLLATVVRQGMLPVVLGVLGGTVVAWFSSQTLARFLYEVQPTDPWSLAGAAGVLLVAGVGAALIPAIRASSTNPAMALRGD